MKGSGDGNIGCGDGVETEPWTAVHGSGRPQRVAALFSWRAGVAGAIIGAVHSIIVVKMFRTQVFEKLRRSFADDPNVEGVIDRRRADRRLQAGDRRRRAALPSRSSHRDPAMECVRLFHHNGEGAP